MLQLAKILDVIQLGAGALLIIAILAQTRGAGLSNVFGGSGAIYRTKRGFEKWLFYATIVLAVVYIIIGVAAVVTTKRI